MKKILALCLVLVLGATAIIGGTLAYFTDTSEATNAFTVGDVDIKLIESQYYPQVDDGKTLEDVVEDAKTYNERNGYLAVNGKDMVPGRWVRKAPYVINDGTNAAYVRIRVEMSKDLWDVIEVMENTTELEKGTITKVLDESKDPVALTYTYTEAIEPDAMTEIAPIWRFRLMEHLDNADLADIQGDVVSQINVTAEAIQAEGFADAAAAFAAFDAQQ